MLRSALLVAVTALSTAASAQLTSGLNYSTSGPLAVDTNQLSTSLKQAWCRAQTNSCPQICGGQASPNTCDQQTLNYTCTCTDGSTPNITNYDQTIPSFVCAQWVANCIDNNPNDRDGQAGCLSVTCGSENATSGESTTATSSAASTSETATTTDSSANTASATTSTPSSSATESSAAMALNIAQHYGTGIMGVGLLAIFGLAL